MYKHNKHKTKDTQKSTTTSLDIIKYDFSESSGPQDIADFLFSMGIDGNLSSTSSREPSEMKKNFYTMLHNFQKFMAYANINEKWRNALSSKTSIIPNDFLLKIKRHIKLFLTEGILNNKHNNLIFEFSGHKLFIEGMSSIYRLLINAVLTTFPELDDHREQILSLCLGHAAACNNSSAIEILLTEYHASAIQTWPAINVRTDQPELTTMPILRITEQTMDKEIFGISWTEQENNFTLMLNHIDFSKTDIENWQILEIFRVAFKNEFVMALGQLLKQKSFCQKLILTNEDLIMIAFRKVAVPSYQFLIESMLNNSNLFSADSSDATIQPNNDAERLKTYIKLLQTILTSKVDGKKFHDTSIKLAIDFIQFLLSKNPEYNTIIALITNTQRHQDELSKKNSALFLQQLKSEETIETLVKNLESLKVEQKKFIVAQTENLRLNENRIQTTQEKLQESERKRKSAELNASSLKDENNELKQKLKAQRDTYENLLIENPQNALFQIQPSVSDVRQKHKLSNENKQLKEENKCLKELLEEQKQKFEFKRQAGIYNAKARDALLKKQCYELQTKTDELAQAKLKLQQFSTNKQLSQKETDEFKEYMAFRLDKGFDTIKDLQDFVECLESELTKFRLLNKTNNPKYNIRPRAFSM